MAPRSRRAAAAAAPAQEDIAHSDASPLSSPGAIESSPPAQSNGSELKFNQPLTWRAGKPIAVGELLKRLQKLSNELKSKEQDEEDTTKDSFVPAAKSLSNEQLLAHKDKGVRAYAACCAVDVLRLCAPTAPFTQKELKAVFDMILKSILPALSDPSHAYNQQHMYVLQSLAEVKSVVLATDLPNADTYVQNLFILFFDILSGSAKSSTGEQLSKQVVNNMGQILVILVDEMEALPQDVVDTIIAQFLRVDSRLVPSTNKPKKGSTDDRQSTLEMKELPPAYSMSKLICNTCQEKMSREVSKYFSDVIVEATASSRKDRRESGDADGMEDSIAGPSDEELKELEKAHRLLKELWRAAPAVLQNVVPQLEAELQAEDVRLRQMATETLGDIVSGIGAAGPPVSPTMDPSAYPQATMNDSTEPTSIVNLFTIPASPQSFPQTYSSTWTAFLGRKQDRSSVIRSTWTAAVGRILVTAAGAVGLSHSEEKQLVEELARMLNDSDEKVRLAGVRAITNFTLRDVVTKLGISGGVDKEGSVLANLSERVKDRKPAVREEAMKALATIWGVGSGELASGNEQVAELVGGAASKILNAFYTNDTEIQLLIDKALFEFLLPLSYPPIKTKGSKSTGGSSQRVQDSQGEANGDERKKEADELRAERVLVLIKHLDERAKKVFFSGICGRQVGVSNYMTNYLRSCEDYNGGVMDKDEETIKTRLTKIIAAIQVFFPDQAKASADMWKFAKAHDRRSYQLVRFCMKPENEFRFVLNSIKEFKKRMESSGSTALLETFAPLIYRCSIIVYSRSHIPTFLEYAKTDKNPLASTAQNVLTEISQRTPEVLKANVKEICQALQNDAPTASSPNSPQAVQTLKTCAAFARKYTDEIPQDQKFVHAMTNFALYGSPPEAAKHAVSIIMAASKRKEMLAKDLVKKCVEGFQYGKTGFLSRLAALSRLCHLAPLQVDEHVDTIVDIAIKELLLKVREPSSESSEAYSWSNEPDEECQAKVWAIRILVNRIRSHPTQATLEETAEPIYELLGKLVAQDGELSSKRDTPASHKSRLRLAAARSYLKLSQSKAHEQMLGPVAFKELCMVAQDSEFPVRATFLKRVKKYLGLNLLTSRFYVVPFLVAYEPDPTFKDQTTTWLKARAAFFATQKAPPIATDSTAKAAVSRVATTLEAVFPRLISLLAHHADYGTEVAELKEFSRYILFYLTTVATESNISLIFHVAQRIKSCNDALESPSTSTSKKSTGSIDYSTRLHTLSDLSTLAMRLFIEAHGWTLQSLPARLTLPRSLFTEIKDHATSQQIAAKSFLPSGVSDAVEPVVRAALRRGGASRKRKNATGDGGSTSKKRSKMVIRDKKEKTPKKRRDWDASDDEEEEDDEDADADTKPNKSAAERIRSQLRHSARKSSSTTAKGIYRERDDSEDDKEMEVAQEDVEAAEEDETMADADDVDEENSEAEKEEEEEEEAPPSVSRVRGKATPKKAASGTPSRSTQSTHKANGTSKPASAKSTPVRSSGRATRSRA